MKVWLNGHLVDKADAKISVFDHGTLYGDGVFEGIRIYNGKIFQCKAHLDRLEISAAALRLNYPYSQQELTDAMLQCMSANGLTDGGYIRLVVTRGEGTLGMNPFLCPYSNTFIIADGIQLYPEEMYESGMPVIIAKTRRRAATVLNPNIKSLNYLNNIMAKIECVDAGMNEALMLNHKGEIAEASGDNIFIVEGRNVITPPPEAGILLGITRSVVMELARRLGYAVTEETVMPERLMAADECFLTGSAAEVIPINAVDHKPIGDGKPGEVTRSLLQAFKKFVVTDEQIPYSGLLK